MPIDRKVVVRRHHPRLTAFDPLSPLSVGNGEFAFTVDLTGLQTFPELYGHAEGIPLCTQSQWGWHIAPPPPGVTGLDANALKLTEYDFHGRTLRYAVESKGQEVLYNYLRENPHRLHLGRVALVMTHSDRPSSIATPTDITDAVQELDLYAGIITSRFKFQGEAVEVITTGTGLLDGLAVRVKSRLIADGHLRISLQFPYGTHQTVAADWSAPNRHQTSLSGTIIRRMVDDTRYTVSLNHSPNAEISQTGAHDLILTAPNDTLELVAVFSGGEEGVQEVPGFDAARLAHAELMAGFWESGGAISFEGSADPRAHELERRMVLSQYLLRINCAGSLPPQETGLTYNTWYGKFHLEMHWWHGAQWALWNRLELLEKSLGYYHDILPAARELARAQGFAGARWPKMTDATGRDSPSPVGPLLIWQQPHPIYYAELCYRARPTAQTLKRWETVVEESAEFMADFARSGDLGPPLKTVSENTDPTRTGNATFELGYWRLGLQWAQRWRERLNKGRNPQWDDTLARLAPYRTDGTHYLMQQGMADTFTTWNWEHPALIGVHGLMPGDAIGIDPVMFRRTVEKVMEVWQWERCWGWDFPMTAMAAARAGRADLAVDALLIGAKKNHYSAAGHNYQRPHLTTYFPGNGGLLAALAMMAAGWDNAPDTHAPGFPKDGTWNVEFENLSKMP